MVEHLPRNVSHGGWRSDEEGRTEGCLGLADEANSTAWIELLTHQCLHSSQQFLLLVINPLEVFLNFLLNNCPLGISTMQLEPKQVNLMKVKAIKSTLRRSEHSFILLIWRNVKITWNYITGRLRNH